MKTLIKLAKGIVFISVFVILYMVASNILDLFFIDNRQLTNILSIFAFFLVIVGSLLVTRSISEWLDQLLR